MLDSFFRIPISNNMPLGGDTGDPEKISGDQAIETEEELQVCDSFEDLEEFEGILSNNSRRKKIVSLIVPRIP